VTIAHSHHLNLILVFLLPWLLVLVDEILVRQRRSPTWLGVALGVVAAAQVLTGEELFATVARCARRRRPPPPSPSPVSSGVGALPT
jgi:hypothetical protein